MILLGTWEKKRKFVFFEILIFWGFGPFLPFSSIFFFILCKSWNNYPYVTIANTGGLHWRLVCPGVTDINTWTRLTTLTDPTKSDLICSLSCRVIPCPHRPQRATGSQEGTLHGDDCTLLTGIVRSYTAQTALCSGIPRPGRGQPIVVSVLLLVNQWSWRRNNTSGPGDNLLLFVCYCYVLLIDMHKMIMGSGQYRRIEMYNIRKVQFFTN